MVRKLFITTSLITLLGAYTLPAFARGHRPSEESSESESTPPVESNYSTATSTGTTQGTSGANGPTGMPDGPSNAH